MQHAYFSTASRVIASSSRGGGLARLRSGRPLVARLHNCKGSGSSGKGRNDAVDGVEPSNLILGGSSSNNYSKHTGPWRPFGGASSSAVGSKPMATTNSGVFRGYKSFVANDGGDDDKGKDTENDGKEDKKCCDHDHGTAAGATEEDEGSTKGKTLPAVLDEEDEDDGAFDITQHPIWNRESVGYLLENNKRWVAQKKAEQPDFFDKLASVHKPEFLFIGCSDARLSVQHMLGLEAGELFVHRNVANMVMHTDLNLLTALTYAVDYLKVKHIIVCGHYDCGGVRAAMRNHDHGLIENWIMGIRDVARYHRKELKQLNDDEAIHRRLVELNVQEQCVKLYANPVVQKSQAKNGYPYIHAMVFDVKHGLVQELDVDFKQIIRKYRHVYSMYDFSIPGK